MDDERWKATESRDDYAARRLAEGRPAVCPRCGETSTLAFGGLAGLVRRTEPFWDCQACGRVPIPPPPPPPVPLTLTRR